MVSTLLLAVLVVAFLVAAGFLALAAHTYRTYDSIGVSMFTALLMFVGLRLLVGLVTVALLLTTRGSGATLGAAQSLGEATTGELLVVGLLTGVNVTVVSFVVATWVTFAAVYTIQLDASRRRLLLYTVVPILAVFLPASLLDIGLRTGVLSGQAVVVARDLGRLLSRGIVFGGTVLGIGLLARVSLQYEYYPDRIAAALSAAMVIHVIVRAVLQELSAALALGVVLQVGTALSALTLALFVGAIRQGLFDALPAAGSVGPRILFEEFEAPIVVLDFTGQVTDINPAACDVFDVEHASVVGRPLSALLPEGVDPERAADLPPELSVPGKDVLLVPRASTVSDRLDREIGQGVLFRDVTDARRRKQQVGVLNRVLRHNLRNEGAIVINHADLLAEGAGDPAEQGAAIQSVMTDLVEMGDTARTAERVIEADPTIPDASGLATILEEAVADVEVVERRVAIDADEGVVVRSNPEILVAVVRELVANAVEHTDGRVSVVAEDRGPDAPLAVRIADEGPGIPDHEVEPLAAGEETALSHGSGLGLWLVQWGVERLGGTLSFDADEAGTTVTVALPRSHLGPANG